MDAFEALIAMLLRHDGYWTTPSFKVDLTKEEKIAIGKFSSPRWELDLVAYKGATNEVLAIECKSFLDSRGVLFRNSKFEPEHRYKLFTDAILRRVVLKRLVKQMVKTGLCARRPRVTLCLAAGKIAGQSDRLGLEQHFAKMNWRLFDSDWIHERLVLASTRGYENDVAFVVSKILLKNRVALANMLTSPKTSRSRRG